MGAGVRRAAVAVLLAMSVTACAGEPEVSPSAGVDELTIPTPSPDPDDFVETVDNPWLSLGAGESVTLAGSAGDLVALVGDEPTTLQGVAVTTWTVGETAYLLAQDRAGNVWRFLEDGGEPGLFMAATPRYGDGYRTAYDEGTFEERATVTDLDDDLVEITTTDPARPGADTVATYEKGTGLVRFETGTGAYER
jgi:hypothetical protein